MQTLTYQQTREVVGQRREAEYVAYHEWLESLRRDEITDAAERVRAPQQTTIEFMLTPEGLVNDLGQALRPIIEDGLAHAEKMALTNPDWQVEVERRRIEREEYSIMEALAAEGEGAGVLVSRWLIPDAVREGHSSLPGYNRERLKMFNRYATPTKNGLIIAYQSLDGSNYQAVQAMDAALGYELQEGVGSEDIARQRRFIPDASLEWLMDHQRTAYDTSLTQQYGGEWYAGRPPIDVKEVVNYVTAQEDLISEQMAIVQKVFALTNDRDERMRQLEPHRYNLAAAIDARLYGQEVKDLQTAGDNARAAGMDYDGDCPPGASAANQAEQLGFGVGRKVTGNCPHCRARVEFDPCAPECSNCGATGTHGPIRKVGFQAVSQAQKSRSRVATRHAAAGQRAATNRLSRPERQTLNGRTFRYERRLVVGGTNTVLIDLETGAELPA